MNNVLSTSIGLSLDLSALMDEAQKKLRQNAQQTLEQKLRILFHDPKNQAELKYHLANGAGKDPDLSYCFKRIDQEITELVCNEKNEAWIKQYIDQEYKKHLQKALDRAMESHASKQAFTTMKEMAKI